MNILVTGCAGFIGFSLSSKLCENKKNNIIGLDNINNYYNTKLKKKRLNILKKYRNFTFFKIDIAKENKLFENFKNKKIDIIINLAAQAGVRYSIINPKTYF